MRALTGELDSGIEDSQSFVCENVEFFISLMCVIIGSDYSH